MGKYLGNYEEFENKDIDELIEEHGKTWGLSIWFAVNGINILENGNWETLRDFMYDELVNWIDE